MKKNFDTGAAATVPQHFEGQRFYSASTWLKNHFGGKTIKLAIDGGFTCPNRDGSKGVGGCAFCSDTGSGEFASSLCNGTSAFGQFASSIDEQIELYSRKWPKAKYLAYFQNHTNTYAPVEVLRKKYYEALKNPKVEGLVIGTRPDCLSEEILDLLTEINKAHFLWIEMGLQTIHEKTSKSLNICYDLATYDEACQQLARRNIKFVVHLILGLPGETEDMMLESVKYVASTQGVFGMKLHLLNIVKGSPMEKTHRNYLPFDSIDSYVDLVVRCLEIIPSHITIHRLTGDAPRPILISPPWSFNKRTILNRINDQLHLRDAWQGKKAD